MAANFGDVEKKQKRGRFEVTGARDMQLFRLTTNQEYPFSAIDPSIESS